MPSKKVPKKRTVKVGAWSLSRVKSTSGTVKKVLKTPNKVVKTTNPKGIAKTKKTSYIGKKTGKAPVTKKISVGKKRSGMGRGLAAMAVGVAGTAGTLAIPAGVPFAVVEAAAAATATAASGIAAGYPKLNTNKRKKTINGKTTKERRVAKKETKQIAKSKSKNFSLTPAQKAVNKERAAQVKSRKNTQYKKNKGIGANKR